jgi:hypothetical protein
MKYIISKYDDIAEALGMMIISGVIIGLAPLTIYLAWVSF